MAICGKRRGKQQGLAKPGHGYAIGTYRFVCRALVITLILVLPAVTARALESNPPKPCELTTSEADVVAQVIDGETLALEGGRQIRLIGALAPRAFDSGAPSKPWSIADEAIQKLKAFLQGRVVQIAPATAVPDRYGRLLAHVFVSLDHEAVWVQGWMLRAGLARAYGLPGAFACADELMAAEAEARTARAGLWNLGTYRPKQAAEPARLMASRSRYEVVTGKVTAVAKTKSAIYVNFGSDFRSDFTARIARTTLNQFPAWAALIDELKDKDVEVRGWIERRNGPLIDISDPSQLLAAGTTSAAARTTEASGSRQEKAQEKSPGLPQKRPGVDL